MIHSNLSVVLDLVDTRLNKDIQKKDIISKLHIFFQNSGHNF